MRITDTDNYRTFREMQAVDPVEAAFRAVACLSNADKAKFATRFNNVFGGDRPNAKTVAFTGLKGVTHA